MAATLQVPVLAAWLTKMPQVLAVGCTPWVPEMNNNDNGYLQLLTRTGPERCHIL